MDNQRLSRKEFIKLGSSAAGALALGSMVPLPVAASAEEAGFLNEQGDGYVPTLCEMCVWRCGVLAKVEDGRVVKLEGNPDHPHSKGRLCARGQSGLMTMYDPDRVLQPLIRVGKRGEGKFRKASWEEALDYTAARMQEIKDRYGPEAMIFSSTHNLSQTQFENFLYSFGSPNYGTQRSLCFNSMVTAFLLAYGIEEPRRNYDDVEFILLTGRNLAEAISTSETGELIAAINRGAKLVYLDPRFTKTAAKADEWIPIRPGTDAAFLLAMINVIVTEDLADCDFVRQYVDGCDQMPEVFAKYTPEWAEGITGVPRETIDRIAREYAAAKHNAMAHPGWRTSNFVNSFQTERAIATLNALSGNVLTPGGCLGADNPEASNVKLGKPPQPAYPRTTARRLDGVPWKYPLVPLKLGVMQEIRDAVLVGEPYQAKGWFVSRQNPALSIPDRKKTMEALEQLEFIAVVDVIMNDTAWYADVILPESSYLERYDPLHVVDDKVFIRQPVVEPTGDTRSALWIYKQLGERLGLDDFFQYENETDYLEQQLAPFQGDLAELRDRGYLEPEVEEGNGEITFNTPTGKIEIYSSTLENAGFSPWPTWEDPPLPEEGELYLLSGKVGQHTQSATQNNQYLHKFEDKPRIWLHTSTAQERGIENNDYVRVTSPVGEVVVQAWVTEGIRSDCAFMAFGYGHRSKGLRTAFANGASDSDLHVTFTDPISGGQALSQTCVKVQRADRP